MDRPTKKFAATLVAGFAGLATVLTGCGGNEPTKTTATTAPATGTTASSPATVDYNDPSELARALATIDVEVAPAEPIERDRAGGAEGLIFPTWPSGEVRKAGLSTYRVDVAPEFDGKARLKFSVGKKVLFEAPFEPANLSTESAIPAIVLESLKVGDRLTWGVYPESKKVKAATLDVTVFEKSGATRKLSQTDSDKALSPMARAFAKANVLQNNGFLSESVMTFVGIGKADPTITSVYAPIVGLLRRLHLKNSPLFHDAMARATAVTPSGPGRSAFNTGGGSSGIGPVGTNTAPISKPGPVAVNKTSGEKKTGLKQGGTGLPPLPTADKPKTDPAADPQGTGARVGQELLMAAAAMRLSANQASDDAKRLGEFATVLRTSADALAKKAADLAKKSQNLFKQSQNPALTNAERLMLEAQSQQAAAEAAQAQAAADIENANATQAEAQAAGAALSAKHLDEQASLLEQGASAAATAMGVGPVVAPGSPQPGGPGPLPGAPVPQPGQIQNTQQLVLSLHTVMMAAQTGYAAATTNLVAAQANLQAAEVANANAPTPATAAAVAQALDALQAATTAKETAQQTMIDAMAAFEAAKGGD